jgi:hypothetical protein
MRRTATAECADLQSSFAGTGQQLERAQRRFLGAVFVLDPMAAPRLAQVLAQQLTVVRIQQSHLPAIPLHLDTPTDPARRCAVVSGFDFDAAIQMHRALAVLVVTKGLDRQRQ